MKVPLIIENFKRMGIKTHKDMSDRAKGVTENVAQLPRNIGDRMKVVFAKPLDVTKHYQLSHPKEQKTKDEIDFLNQAFLESDEFIFQNLSSSEKERLIAATQLCENIPNDKIIIQQGDVGDYLYILKQGKLNFLVDGKLVGSTDSPGAIFGELALLYDAPRAATVQAATSCTLYRVSQHAFRMIQAAHVLENVNEAEELLKRTPLFEELPEEYIKRLADSLFQQKLKKNDILVEKGSEVNAVYMIKEGYIKGVDITIGETKYADIRLGPGECFGEGAILRNTPFVAKAFAASDAVVWVLTKERFLRTLGDLDLKQLIQKAQDVKFLAAVPMLAYSDVDKVEISQLATRMSDKSYPKGTQIAKIGEYVAPTLSIIQQGSVTLSNQKGITKTLGQGEIFGFGGETLVLTNSLKKKQQQEEKISEDDANLHKEGFVALNSTAAIHMAEQNLKNNSVVAQHDVQVVGDTELVVRELTLDDIRKVLYDPLRLGKNYSKTAKTNPDLTKEKLEKIRLLGAGTFGQVWLTKDAKTESPYAMKIQYKRELIDYNQADGVIREKRIMERMHHPFVMSIVNAQQDKYCLYMMMELIQGGELRSQMRNDHIPFLKEDSAKFYAACMLEGLSYMHRRHFIYRDLKGENVLIDKDGYCVIVDLGFAKFVPDKTFTFCGTPIFIAPEIVLNKGHDKSADIWSWGVLIYEMLYGTNPFFDYDDPNIDQKTLFRQIISGKYEFPKPKRGQPDPHVSEDAKDLIRKILVVNVPDRLGCMAGADLDIRAHPWFRGIDFGKLYRKEIKAPWVPTIKSPFDGHNFAHWDEEDKRDLKPLSDKEQKQFVKFC